MTTTQYEARVHRVMDHVRRNLAGSLTLEEVAKVACFSPYHFHRIFKATAGETLLDFARRARLERAAYLMKAAPRRRLGSIALEVGFGSQSDFSRVFRSAYGIPPSAWDRRSRLDGVGIPKVTDEPDPPIAARIVRHPACRLAYVRMVNPFMHGTLPHGYARLVTAMEQRGVAWRDCALIGLSWDHYDATPLDRVRFDLGFAVGDDVEAGDDAGIHRFPAVRTVDAHSCGPLSRVAQAWDFLYMRWFPASRYEPDDMPAMKRFRRRPDETGWDLWDVDCSIAIRPLGP